MIASSKKQRHEIKDGMIKAVYGHSIDISPQYQDEIPPAELYHGTSKEAVANIMIHGLKPMMRLYVHLSSDSDMAYIVGTRKEKQPAILKVQALKASNNGIKFYHANKDVWLSKFIPMEFIDTNYST